jgi:hypothetical protein
MYSSATPATCGGLGGGGQNFADASTPRSEQRTRPGARRENRGGLIGPGVVGPIR